MHIIFVVWGPVEAISWPPKLQKKNYCLWIVCPRMEGDRNILTSWESVRPSFISWHIYEVLIRRGSYGARESCERLRNPFWRGFSFASVRTVGAWSSRTLSKGLNHNKLTPELRHKADRWRLIQADTCGLGSRSLYTARSSGGRGKLRWKWREGERQDVDGKSGRDCRSDRARVSSVLTAEGETLGAKSEATVHLLPMVQLGIVYIPSSSRAGAGQITHI